MNSTIKNWLGGKPAFTNEKPVTEAYDTWSASYDSQPGNLMLDLDEIIFTGMLEKIHVENKRLVDIGCGTGRHWQKLYNKKPASLTGYDVSAGMLEQLKKKFPSAMTYHTAGDLLTGAQALSADVIISTLTMAHIKNMAGAIASWSGILVNGGDIIITDFHPAVLVKGGRRSFRHNDESIFVTNYIHAPEKIIQLFKEHGFDPVHREERFIDENVKHYYESQNATAVYDRFKGLPVIYGLHLKKDHAAE